MILDLSDFRPSSAISLKSNAVYNSAQLNLYSSIEEIIQLSNEEKTDYVK